MICNAYLWHLALTLMMLFGRCANAKDANVMTTQDARAPHRVVEEARRFIRENLRGDLRPRVIAKALGVQLQDLHGSYECATITTLELDLIKIKLHALYEDIKAHPDVNDQLQAQRCGLEYGEGLEQDFEAEFWISIQDHRHSCRHAFGASTHQRLAQK